MRKFLDTVGRAFQIGEQNEENEPIGQGAVVTFSEESTVQIFLNQSVTPGEFSRVINDMPGPLVGGRTRTDIALKQANDEVVVASAGFRENDEDVAKILVVITDGKQTRGRGSIPASQAIQPFHDSGLDVFAIGVGPGVDTEEIRGLVRDPQNALFPESYTALNSSVADFVRRFCPGMKNAS